MRRASIRVRGAIAMTTLVLSAAIPAWAQRGIAPVPAVAGDVRKGQQLYTDTGCYQCHGRVAQGAVSGPRLAPRPLPLAGLSRYVRRPTGVMPPFTAKVLSERDIADIYAFLLTIPEPPPVATIPFLNR